MNKKLKQVYKIKQEDNLKKQIMKLNIKVDDMEQ